MRIIQIIKTVIISLMAITFLYVSHVVTYKEGVKDGLAAGAAGDDFVRQYLKRR